VAHLLNGDTHDRLAPLLNGVSLPFRKPACDSVFQAERDVEIAAHQRMLDFGSFSEQMKNLLSRPNYNIRLV